MFKQQLEPGKLERTNQFVSLQTQKWNPPRSEHGSGAPPRNRCRRGGEKGPAEKYCWASGRYALEKKASLCYHRVHASA